MLPQISHLAASPCGKLLAVVTPHAVHLLRRHTASAAEPFANPKPLAMPHPPASRPVTAICFSPCSHHLAVSTVDERLELYATASRTRHEWLHRVKGLRAKLDLLAGHVVSVAFRPGDDGPAAAAAAGGGNLGSIMLCSRTRVCHMSLQALKAGTPLTGAGDRAGRRRTKAKGFAGEAPGRAVRVMALRTVLLGAGWVSSSSFLSVQADREAALARLPAPLMLKLYGQ